MPNPYLSGRIPAELDKQVGDFLARTGETRTQMLIRAVSAYIGIEPPLLKAAGDRRIENLELEVAELKGGLQSLYEMFVAFTSKIENSKVQIEPIIAYENSCDNDDNNTDNSNPIEEIDQIDYTFSDTENVVDIDDNYIATEKTNTVDNIFDNGDNKAKVSSHIDVMPTINNEKTFIKIETAAVAKLTKLESKTINNFWTSFKRKLNKEDQSLPQKKILDNPIKMTPSLEVKIEKVPYDIFYVGQSQEGKNLWNLVPENTPGEQIPLTFSTDNT